MQKLTSAQTLHIITLLDSGLSGASGGHPAKLSTANIDYARCIICMGRVDNATQATQVLQDSYFFPNIVLSTQIQKNEVCSKEEWPLLTPHHRKARMEFAERSMEWTLENWKKVIWSDETKHQENGCVKFIENFPEFQISFSI